MQEEKLCERAEKVGEMIMGRLKKFAAGKDYIGEVRGRGLMIGIEFNDKNGGPSKELADKVAERCLEHKMIVLTCGNAGQVIRLIPPLNISDADAQKACDILEKAMTF